MPGLLDDDALENVFKAWQRALRLHPLLSRVVVPDLRPFAAAFNLALAGEDDEGALAARCDDLGAAAIEPDAIIEITTELAASFTDELGITSGAQIKSIIVTQGHVCALLTGKMVRDERDVAQRDSLTALENRHAWIQALARDARAQRTIALVSVDLDGLKAVNDNSEEGHLAGDRYIRTFASDLALALPDNATPYRVGGDEFAIRWLDESESAVRGALEALGGKEGVAPFCFGIAYGLVEMTPEEDRGESDLIAGAALYSVADELERQMKEARKATAATTVESSNAHEGSPPVTAENGLEGTSEEAAAVDADTLGEVVASDPEHVAHQEHGPAAAPVEPCRPVE